MMNLSKFPKYIIEDLLKYEISKDIEFENLLKELKKRKINFASFDSVSLTNLIRISKITKVEMIFNLESFVLSQTDYFKILQFISFDINSEDLIYLENFLEKIIKTSKDLLTREKSLSILAFIDDLKAAKNNNFKEIIQISSLRKIELIEAFSKLPIYEIRDRIKIARYIYSKGYLDELNVDILFNRPEIQIYYHLHQILFGEGDISHSIYYYLNCFKGLNKETQRQILELIKEDDLKNYIKKEIKISDSSLFEKAWKFVSEIDNLDEKILHDSNQKAFEVVNKFIDSNSSKKFEDIFDITEDVLSTKIFVYYFAKNKENIEIKAFEKEHFIDLHPFKYILNSLEYQYNNESKANDEYLDFIKSIVLDEKSVVEGRNNIRFSELLDKTIYFKFKYAVLDMNALVEYILLIPEEVLKEKKYLLNSLDEILDKIDFNNEKHTAALKSLLTSFEAGSNIKKKVLKYYRKNYTQEYAILSDILKNKEDIFYSIFKGELII